MSRKFTALTACLVTGGMSIPGAALAASCPVPNIIANGQVADASKVMDNFNAVANCAQAAVTTAGTPIAGSIATMSGANTIASGNLSGDVTTSGSTATTLSNSGVIAGTYSSANMTVDAKGRVTSASNGSGSDSGGNWWFAPPLAAQFILGSGTSTNLTLSNGRGGLLVDGGPPVSGDVSRIAYQVLNDKNAPWDLKVRVEGLVSTDNYSGYGIIMRDSTSGRISSFASWHDGTALTVNLDGYSGYNSTPASSSPRTPVKWLRIQHDGANYKYFISGDGEQWIGIGSVANTSWLTGKADQVGIGIDYNRSNGGIDTTMVVEYYSLVQ